MRIAYGVRVSRAGGDDMKRTRVPMSHLKNLKATLFAAAAAVALAGPASADFVKQTNLVTDDQGVNTAQITDTDLVNAWGMSYAPGSPIWVSDNGTGVATLYRINPATNATTKVNTLTVSIPGDGSVNGQAFNGNSSAFNGDLFLFTSEDGTISGWRGALGTAAETLQPASNMNLYKGMTLTNVGGHTYLLSANFKSGAIDVLKGDGAAPNLSGTFTDPTIPAGYHPFNVQLLNGHVFVTYALNTGGHDEAHGAGEGFVSEFDTNGNFIARIASHGALNAPWGLALAPSSFGGFGGDLLVGNFGDGHINIYNTMTDKWVGMLLGQNGSALMIDGLWGLIPGNGTNAGNPNDIYFSAGPSGENDGLLGALSFVPEPASMFLFAAGLLGFAARRRFGVTI
jgi:uncharacterized protein (TIGR03118 family)